MEKVGPQLPFLLLCTASNTMEKMGPKTAILKDSHSVQHKMHIYSLNY